MIKIKNAKAPKAHPAIKSIALDKALAVVDAAAPPKALPTTDELVAAVEQMDAGVAAVDRAVAIAAARLPPVRKGKAAIQTEVDHLPKAPKAKTPKAPKAKPIEDTGTLAAFVKTQPKGDAGIVATEKEADAAFEARYGAASHANSSYLIKKTKMGNWYWGPAVDLGGDGKLVKRPYFAAPNTKEAKAKGDSKAKAAVKRAAKAEVRKSKAAGPKKARPDGKTPSPITADILKLASRKNGVSPQELNDLTQWKGAPWRWNFTNPKGKGYCDRFGYSFEVAKVDGETRYKVAKL